MIVCDHCPFVCPEYAAGKWACPFTYENWDEKFAKQDPDAVQVEQAESYCPSVYSNDFGG